MNAAPYASIWSADTASKGNEPPAAVRPTKHALNVGALAHVHGFPNHRENLDWQL